MQRLIVGVVAATLAVAACGGSSKKSSTPAASGASTTTSAGGPTSTAAGGGGSDEFSQLVAKSKSADVKITYTWNGKPLTIAQDGKGKSSYSTDGNLTISDGAKTISCDGTTSSATCTDLSAVAAGGGSGVAAIFTGVFTALTTLSASAYGGHTSSETIAGRDATCVTFKASDFAPLAALAGGGSLGANASSTACADKETGFALKFSTTDGSTTKEVLLATEFSASSSSDFNPPSTPQTLPSIPGFSTTVPSG